MLTSLKKNSEMIPLTFFSRYLVLQESNQLKFLFPLIAAHAYNNHRLENEGLR